MGSPNEKLKGGGEQVAKQSVYSYTDKVTTQSYDDSNRKNKGEK